MYQSWGPQSCSRRPCLSGSPALLLELSFALHAHLVVLLELEHNEIDLQALLLVQVCRLEVVDLLDQLLMDLGVMPLQIQAGLQCDSRCEHARDQRYHSNR